MHIDQSHTLVIKLSKFDCKLYRDYHYVSQGKIKVDSIDDKVPQSSCIPRCSKP